MFDCFGQFVCGVVGVLEDGQVVGFGFWCVGGWILFDFGEQVLVGDDYVGVVVGVCCVVCEFGFFGVGDQDCWVVVVYVQFECIGIEQGEQWY